jgi:hypothetical protein
MGAGPSGPQGRPGPQGLPGPQGQQGWAPTPPQLQAVGTSWIAPIDSSKAITSRIDLMLAPIDVFASMIEMMTKLQQETWVVMPETATVGCRELTRN